MNRKRNTLSPHKHIDGSLVEPSAKKPWELLRVQQEPTEPGDRAIYRTPQGISIQTGFGT